MPKVSGRGGKRKYEDKAVGTDPTLSSKVYFISPSRILVEIPPGADTSLPVWQAFRSQQVDFTWSVNPYSISVHLTPTTSEIGKSTTSSQRASTSGCAQTSVRSSGIPQPQTVVQTSSALLNLPHSSTQLPPSPSGQPKHVVQNPPPATNVLLSTPFINQPKPAPQPSSLSMKQLLPDNQIPKSPPTSLQALPTVPVPSPFHTVTSTDVEICDDFLLGLCRKANKCQMHHTPYPFHWQLWCLRTHQWVDVRSQSQLILERLYCDVSQEFVCVQDGPLRYSLHFESMDLDEFTKYDAVRRLTNSDSPDKNPHFPSKWRVYWWNNHEWEEYSKDLSNLLLGKMKEKEPDCFFKIGSQSYSVDFTIMIQTNVTTGFKREVRYRPLYRSPDSMKPHLRTGLYTAPAGPVGDPPGENFKVDPLEEFSSWYPPVWCLASEQDYRLVDVPAGTTAYRSVQKFFYESLPETEVDIVSIHQVQNVLQWDKYQRHKVYMQKHNNSTQLLERHVFHGTTKEASDEICHNNFDPRVAGVNGTSHGYGSYFATKASVSNTFTDKTGPSEIRHMFLAKVLVGNMSVGRNHYRRPPLLVSKTKQFCRYDTCVDNIHTPSMFVVFDSCQCYPYYLIKYNDLPSVIEI